MALTAIDLKAMTADEGAKPDTNFQMKLRLLRMSIEISRTLAKRFDQGTIVRTCFHRLSMEVVLFGGKETGVTQKIACETYLVGTISCNGRGGNVAKKMRVNRPEVPGLSWNTIRSHASPRAETEDARP